MGRLRRTWKVTISPSLPTTGLVTKETTGEASLSVTLATPAALLAVFTV